MILLDTSGLLAAVDGSQRHHAAAREVLEDDPGPLVLSPFVLAELDYLLGARVGIEAELALLAEVTAGAFDLAPFGPADVGVAADVVRRYRDQAVGLADASIVVLAGRYRTDRVLTLDAWHFGVLRTPSGHPFTMLPERR